MASVCLSLGDGDGTHTMNHAVSGHEAPPLRWGGGGEKGGAYRVALINIVEPREPQSTQVWYRLVRE